jgi:hypothetical protein
LFIFYHSEIQNETPVAKVYYAGMSPRCLLARTAFLLVGLAAWAGAAPLRVLILSVANNHDWRDEFWEGSILSAGAIVLATVTPQDEFGGSGKPEPVALATTLGAGRGFTLLLGHDAAAIKNEGFMRLLRRGTEWAATGAVSSAPSSLTTP